MRCLNPFTSGLQTLPVWPFRAASISVSRFCCCCHWKGNEWRWCLSQNLKVDQTKCFNFKVYFRAKGCQPRWNDFHRLQLESAAASFAVVCLLYPYVAPTNRCIAQEIPQNGLKEQLHSRAREGFHLGESSICKWVEINLHKLSES